MKDIKKVLFLSAFLMTVISCARDFSIPPSSKTLEQTIGHLLDEDASCSIAENTQIIHLPQIHKHPEPLKSDLPKKILDFFQDIAAQSQFLIAHIITQNPSRIVFNEGSQFVVTEKVKQNIKYVIKSENGSEETLSHQDIADAFSHRLPPTFNSLNKDQKHLLLKLGAAPVAFSLDHITTIHRTHSPFEARLLEQSIPKIWNKQKELKSETHDLYARILAAEENKDKKTLRDLYKEARQLSEQRTALEEKGDQLIMNKREKILFREVSFFLENNPSHKIFIIYGAAHDLSDDFSEDSFYTLPHHCTMPKDFTQSSFYAGYLESWADHIRLENNILLPSHIQSIRALYQKSYDILTDIVEKHIQEGGDKEESSMSWNSESNRYLSYSELESIAENIYIKKTALENLIQELNNKL